MNFQPHKPNSDLRHHASNSESNLPPMLSPPPPKTSPTNSEPRLPFPMGLILLRRLHIDDLEVAEVRDRGHRGGEEQTHQAHGERLEGLHLLLVLRRLVASGFGVAVRVPGIRPFGPWEWVARVFFVRRPFGAVGRVAQVVLGGERVPRVFVAPFLGMGRGGAPFFGSPLAWEGVALVSFLGRKGATSFCGFFRVAPVLWFLSGHGKGWRAFFWESFCVGRGGSRLLFWGGRVAPVLWFLSGHGKGWRAFFWESFCVGRGGSRLFFLEEGWHQFCGFFLGMGRGGAPFFGSPFAWEGVALVSFLGRKGATSFCGFFLGVGRGAFEGNLKGKQLSDVLRVRFQKRHPRILPEWTGQKTSI